MSNSKFTAAEANTPPAAVRTKTSNFGYNGLLCAANPIAEIPMFSNAVTINKADIN